MENSIDAVHESVLPVSLSHVGEVIFAEMLNRRPAALRELLGLLGVRIPRSSNPIAQADVRLDSYGGKRFDGKHRLDVSLKYETGKVVAVELKLGETALGKSKFAAWCKTCCPGHEDTSWKGSMMAILERNFPEESDDTLRTCYEDGREGEEVEHSWLLVVRRRYRDAIVDHGVLQNATVCAFEDFVDDYGGKNEFDQLVRELMPKDWFEEWRLQEG